MIGVELGDLGRVEQRRVDEAAVDGDEGQRTYRLRRSSLNSGRCRAE
jgi:hypothetical protein